MNREQEIDKKYLKLNISNGGLSFYCPLQLHQQAEKYFTTYLSYFTPC
jgi:hypothetical protein